MVDVHSVISFEALNGSHGGAENSTSAHSVTKKRDEQWVLKGRLHETYQFVLYTEEGLKYVGMSGVETRA